MKGTDRSPALSWRDLEDRFVRVQEAFGAARLSPLAVVRVEDGRARWDLLGRRPDRSADDDRPLPDEWDLLRALSQDGGLLANMAGKAEKWAALDAFDFVADLAGRTLSRRRPAAKDEPCPRDQWCQEVLRYESARLAGGTYSSSKKDALRRALVGTIRSPAESSARLCAVLALTKASRASPRNRSRARTQSDEWPALDASGIEETILRYLAPFTSPRSLHDIASQNPGKHERPVCKRALRRLAEKGYVHEPGGPGNGWAATDHGKALVARAPELFDCRGRRRSGRGFVRRAEVSR